MNRTSLTVDPTVTLCTLLMGLPPPRLKVKGAFVFLKLKENTLFNNVETILNIVLVSESLKRRDNE